MNSAKLRHVVAVDRFGSITRAAQHLRVTQSAVTKSVADVERELGYPLFDRLARGVSTTIDGRIFIDRAHRIMSDLDQLIADGRAERGARDSLLRVVVCPASIEGLMNRAVRWFITNNPNCRLHLFTSVIEEGIRLLRQGDVDICIGAEERLSVIDEFDSQPLPHLSASLFCRKDHPLAGQAKLSAEDLAPYPIILPDQGTYMERLPVHSAEGNHRVRSVHILEHFTMVSDIVSTTDTLGIVAKGYAKTTAFGQQFRVLPFNVGRAMPFAIATRARWPETRQINQFRSALEKYPLTGTPR